MAFSFHSCSLVFLVRLVGEERAQLLSGGMIHPLLVLWPTAKNLCYLHLSVLACDVGLIPLPSHKHVVENQEKQYTFYKKSLVHEKLS